MFFVLHCERKLCHNTMLLVAHCETFLKQSTMFFVLHCEREKSFLISYLYYTQFYKKVIIESNINFSIIFVINAQNIRSAFNAQY